MELHMLLLGKIAFTAVALFLAGLVLPRIIDQPDKARVVKAKMQMDSLSMALKQYKMDNGFYPTTEQGLRALVEKTNLGRFPHKFALALDTPPKVA